MSHPPQLPPRCPPRRKGLSPSAPEFIPAKQHTLSEQDSLFSKQPFWFDDSLCSLKPKYSGQPLRRACSDSDAIMDVLLKLDDPISPGEDVTDWPDSTFENDRGRTLEAACVFGPNSPRQRSKLTSSESSMVHAVLENVPCNPLEYFTLDTPTGSNACQPSGSGQTNTSSGYSDSEKRRRSGKRSRSRRLQYIADLERNVDVLQNHVADLATQVASLCQLRAALSVENKTLRMHINNLQLEKSIKDGDSQNMRGELQRLKEMNKHCRSRRMTFSSDDPHFNLQMPDVGRLSLIENFAPSTKFFGSS